jgi:deoxycytidine triphosphate deaminase
MKHVFSKKTLTQITGIQAEDVQPNAIDIRLNTVFAIGSDLFEISNQHKKHRTPRLIEPDEQGYYNLEPGHYEVLMENIVTVGDHETGWVITRSTLNRNGCFLTSGLYDSGYHGNMAAVLHITCGPARIKNGTRIGQYLCFGAEMLNQYNGDYGIGKETEKRYLVES